MVLSREVPIEPPSCCPVLEEQVALLAGPGRREPSRLDRPHRGYVRSGRGVCSRRGRAGGASAGQRARWLGAWPGYGAQRVADAASGGCAASAGSRPRQLALALAGLRVEQGAVNWVLG